MKTYINKAKIPVLLLVILFAVSLSSFPSRMRYPLYNGVVTHFAEAEKVYIAEIDKCEYVESGKYAVLNTTVKSVFKGNCISGQRTKVLLWYGDEEKRIGIEEGVLYFFMVGGINTYYLDNPYGAEPLSSNRADIIRIEKDKTLKQQDDSRLYSDTMQREPVETTCSPLIGYDSLIRSVTKAQSESGMLTVYTGPYVACFLIGLVVMLLCYLFNGRILLDNVITFFISFLILFVNSLSIETAAFYLNFSSVDIGDVIHYTVYPLVILTAINVALSLVVRIIRYKLKKEN